MPTVTRFSSDLYAVLGVDATVGGEEIAKAFRARAKQIHPDTSDDPQAAEKFGELVAAYGVLSNHRTRREYDDGRVVTSAGKVAASPAGPVRTSPRAAPAARSFSPARWSGKRAWTALVGGALVAVLGIGAACLTWQLHQSDARRRAHYIPVTANLVDNGDIAFLTTDGRAVETREPEQHGEGSGTGPGVKVRYDPADPAHVIVDANTTGRDITLWIVSLKLLIGGPVFMVLGGRRLRAIRRSSGAV